MQARHAFLEADAKDSRYIECPNDSPERLAALADFSVLQMEDWPTAPAAAARNSLLRHARPLWLGAGSRLDRVLFAPVLIAACARSAWLEAYFVNMGAPRRNAVVGPFDHGVRPHSIGSQHTELQTSL